MNTSRSGCSKMSPVGPVEAVLQLQGRSIRPNFHRLDGESSLPEGRVCRG